MKKLFMLLLVTGLFTSWCFAETPAASLNKEVVNKEEAKATQQEPGKTQKSEQAKKQQPEQAKAQPQEKSKAKKAKKSAVKPKKSVKPGVENKQDRK